MACYTVNDIGHFEKRYKIANFHSLKHKSRFYYIKKSIFLCALAIVAMAAFSCKKTSGEAPKPEFYPCNDADVLLHRVLIVDENGEIVGTCGGLQLDEADPGKVTIVAVPS